MEKFLHARSDLPQLIQIGLVHAQFETIHPFLDGNGRIGRLAITLLLCEREILKRPVLTLSHYLKRNRAEYYEKLQAVRDAGQWEAWLEFFLSGIIEVSDEAAATARRMIAMREDHRALITKELGRSAGNGLRVQDHLFTSPIISVSNVQELIGVTAPAANTLVRRLEKCGILTEITGNKRNRRFRYEPYVMLFTAGT